MRLTNQESPELNTLRRTNKKFKLYNKMLRRKRCETNVHLSNTQLVQFIMASGKITYVMGMAFSIGQMGHATKVNGPKTRPMVMVASFM